MTKISKHILTALAVAAGLGVAGPALAASSAQVQLQPAVYQQAVGYGAPTFEGQVEHVRHGFRGRGFHRGFRGRGFHGRGFHRGFHGRGFYGHRFHRGFHGRFHGGFHKGFHGKKFHGKGLAFRKGFRRY